MKKILFAALSYGAGALGALAMRGKGSPRSVWFKTLRKPSFQPPNRVFGPVWMALYGAIAYSGYRIYRSAPSRERTVALGLWGAQMILNGMWTPIFFRGHKPRAALADMIALDATSAAYTAVAARVDKPAAAAFVPYLGWLGFATALNAKIVAKN